MILKNKQTLITRLQMKITKISTLLTILMLVLFPTFGVAYRNTSPQVRLLKVGGFTPEQKKSHLYTTYIKYCLMLSMRRAQIFERHKFIMEFRVERDGRISGYNVIKLSDSIEYDRKVLQTVLNTGPFHPLPEEIHRDFTSYRLSIDGANLNLEEGSPEMKHKVEQNGPSQTVPISKAKRLSVTCSESNTKPYLLTMLVNIQIQANWFPPLRYNSTVGVSFIIDEAKNVADIKITSGKDKKAIASALYAIRSIKQLHSSSAPHSNAKVVECWFGVNDAINTYK